MIKKKVTLHGLSATADINTWIEKIPTAVAKQIDPSDESALIDIQVRLHAQHASGERYFVEANLYARKMSLHAEADNEKLSAAIEKVRDELVSELTSEKKKREHFVRKGGRAIKDFVRGLYEKKNR